MEIKEKQRGKEMKVVSYLIVSKHKQTSTKEQQGILNNWIKANGHSLYKVITDVTVSVLSLMSLSYLSLIFSHTATETVYYKYTSKLWLKAKQT